MNNHAYIEYKINKNSLYGSMARKEAKNMDKITPDIMYHFGYDLDKTVDFFTMPRQAFLQEYPLLSDIHYNNTCLFWLNRIQLTSYIQTPIGQLEGIDIAKIYHKRGIEPLDLFILCS